MEAEAKSEKSLSETMQEKLTEGLESAFEMVHTSKHEHYLKNPQDIPSVREIDSLIKVAATKNAAISGASSLIPGPWGMVAVVPELIAVMRLQIGLIYDIGAAYGKKDVLTKELALGIFVSALGSSAGSVLVIRGGTVLVKRASLRVMQTMIAMLGGKIAQGAIKSAVAKWLPGVGAAAMAAWSAYMTKQIGEKAKEIMQKEIEEDGSAALDVDMINPLDVAAADDVIASLDDPAAFGKIQVLIDLAKVDGALSAEEREALEAYVDCSDCSAEQRQQLRSFFDGPSQPLQGMEQIAGNPETAIGLLSSLVSFAKKDGSVHIAEKLYIKRVAALLGFSSSEVDDFLVSG